MLCSGLSSTLLLAATCLLMTSGFAANQPFPGTTERVISCDSINTVQRLSCETGVISVQASVYGRTDAETCSEGRSATELSDTDCSQNGTLAAIKKRCDGQKVCETNTNVISTDPCSDTYKYLDTTFACFPASRRVTCESSIAHLRCGEGQILLIHSADYGRHDTTTCSFGRPASQLENVVCSEPSSKVADGCNGKSSCTVTASNSVFGDPCPNTYKYLEVVYSCYFPLEGH